MSPVSTEGEYQVGAGEVTLDVVIGQGQRGRALVLLNGREVARGSDTVHARLGPGPGLAGSRVEVFATVNWTNTATTRSSVSYGLRGGQFPVDRVAEGDFNVHGEPTDYEAAFDLR